jgi:2-polyprenyl-3-methyl-5-hydroxy-6-metoxy-1,4-benzoquinol methylase
MSSTSYVLGHRPGEIDRLKSQAKLLEPCTRRLLSAAGIKEGMRILDVGCGTGAVSHLAAEMVGERGSVMALDRSSIAIEEAQKYSRSNLIFLVSTLEELDDDERFDMVIGRYVLCHQPDARVFLKRAMHFLRPGGCIALHEVDLTNFVSSSPENALWNAVQAELPRRFKASCPEADVAARMVTTFVSAGLSVPQMFCEISMVGGIDTGVVEWRVSTLQSLSGGADTTTLANGTVIHFASATAEIRRVAEETGAQLHGAYQYCAWASPRTSDQLTSSPDGKYMA